MPNNWLHNMLSSVGSAIARSRERHISSLLVKTAMWGYHVYTVVWEPRVRESFVVMHESGNDNDRHAMAVYCDEDPGTLVSRYSKATSQSSR